MSSLADKAILSGAENRPLMLEKDMYDSWKSRMELYMLNRQHNMMILESVEHGPLLWPSLTEDGVTRLKKYSELSSADVIQADCDVKATNIILQALPPEIYALRWLLNKTVPGLQSLTSGQISSELDVTYAPSTITPQRPSERDLDILFEPFHNKYLGGRPSEAPRTIPAAPVLQNLQASAASMSFQDSAPAPTKSSNTLVSSHNVDASSQ
nr:hypothetical protein [Tanacetum cinerariifolium]